MKTTEQLDGQEQGKSPSTRGGVPADTLDVVLLILTILVLTGAATGIVIGFPQALEIIAVQAHAAAIAVAADAQAPEQQERSADEDEDETEPFFADDIRSAAGVYATTGAPVDSASDASAVSR